MEWTKISWKEENKKYTLCDKFINSERIEAISIYKWSIKIICIKN